MVAVVNNHQFLIILVAVFKERKVDFGINKDNPIGGRINLTEQTFFAAGNLRENCRFWLIRTARKCNTEHSVICFGHLNQSVMSNMLCAKTGFVPPGVQYRWGTGG